MKVLMLAVDDWANTGWRFSRCLKLLGYEVEAFKRNKHVFGYTEQWDTLDILARRPVYKSLTQVVQAPELKGYMEEFDVIHFIASSFIDTGLDLTKKFVVVNHGGSGYRNHSERVSAFFNQFVDASLIQCPDLLNLGAKNEHLIYYPVDVNFIRPTFNRIDKKLVVGHFPSTAIVKGTKEILKVVDMFEDKINYVGIRDLNDKKNRLEWKDNLVRVSKCDVIIETMNTELILYTDINGRKIKSGEWGNTALEAAASGKIVITNTISKHIYEKEYGELPLLIANNGEQLKQRLEEVISMSKEEIMSLKHKMRQWAEDNHSLEATAKRLEDKIYGKFHA